MYILVRARSTTKYSTVKSCREVDGKLRIAFLIGVIVHFKCIDGIHSDRALSFINNPVKGSSKH